MAPWSIGRGDDKARAHATIHWVPCRGLGAGREGRCYDVAHVLKDYVLL